MKVLIRYLIFFPLSYLNRFYINLYHKLLLKLKNVKYKELPNFKGKLIIYNDGICTLGRGLTFSGHITSNMVGLFKQCTIAVTKGSELVIDDNSGFSGISIYCSKSIKIGKNVNCGGNVCIWDTDFHPLDYVARRNSDVNLIVSLPITIEDDVFIGANSIVLKGVSIGARSIIGAGSVVTKNIPQDEVWAGNPAKFIRKIN